MQRFVTIAVLLVTVGWTPFLSAKDVWSTDPSRPCLLDRDTDDSVWLRSPIIALGMVGVWGNPSFHLSPATAKPFLPLTTELAESRKDRGIHLFGLPSPAQTSDPLILVQLEGELRLQDEMDRSYELTSAKLIHAEFVSPEWRKAWRTLDKGIKEIAAVTRTTAPGEEKTRRLAELIERSSKALNAMTECRVEAKSRDLVRKIEPSARVVRLFQTETEAEWGGRLRENAATLRIRPATPFSEPPVPCPLTELLAKSESAEQFLAMIKKDWPEGTLDEPLVYLKSLKKSIYVWQVEDLPDEQFTLARAQAKKELAERQSEPDEAQRQEMVQKDTTVAEWNVVLRPAGADLLAEKGLLWGDVVQRILGDKSSIGLLAGDVIIHVSSPGGIPSVAIWGGKVTVLRGNRLVKIIAPRP